jgi:hypothetical protein
MTLKSWQSPMCLVAYDVEQDIGSAICQQTSCPSQKNFPSAQSLCAARFVERSPVKIAPPILDFLHLCTLRELRLLRRFQPTTRVRVFVIKDPDQKRPQ